MQLIDKVLAAAERGRVFGGEAWGYSIDSSDPNVFPVEVYADDAASPTDVFFRPGQTFLKGPVEKLEVKSVGYGGRVVMRVFESPREAGMAFPAPPPSARAVTLFDVTITDADGWSVDATRYLDSATGLISASTPTPHDISRFRALVFQGRIVSGAPAGEVWATLLPVIGSAKGALASGVWEGRCHGGGPTYRTLAAALDPWQPQTMVGPVGGAGHDIETAPYVAAYSQIGLRSAALAAAGPWSLRLAAYGIPR